MTQNKIQNTKILPSMDSDRKNIKNDNNTLSFNIKKFKNEFNFKEVASEYDGSVKPVTYIFRYNPLYSLLYITIIIVILYIFILLRDFVQNHLNEQLTSTLNTILKYNKILFNSINI